MDGPTERDIAWAYLLFIIQSVAGRTFGTSYIEHFQKLVIECWYEDRLAQEKEA